MMTSVHYGHIIKHLETTHLLALPVPSVDADTAEHFLSQIQSILDARNHAYALTTEAQSRFDAAIGSVEVSGRDVGFSVQATALFKGRRRLEANYFAPLPAAILAQFEYASLPTEPLRDVTERVWWMSRFKRVYGDGGIPYLSADELFTVNPSDSKRILVQPDDGHEAYFVEKDWIIMACSGQTYGLNGAALLATGQHQNTFFSHDLIRIVPDKTRIRGGYLLTALTHPTLGRPLLIRAAYGTSIPHLDPGDVASFPVVRLPANEEDAIADLAEESAAARSHADALERQVSIDAGAVLDAFIAGDRAPVELHLA